MFLSGLWFFWVFFLVYFLGGGGVLLFVRSGLLHFFGLGFFFFWGYVSVSLSSSESGVVCLARQQALPPGPAGQRLFTAKASPFLGAIAQGLRMTGRFGCLCLVTGCRRAEHAFMTRLPASDGHSLSYSLGKQGKESRKKDHEKARRRKKCTKGRQKERRRTEEGGGKKEEGKKERKNE